MTPRKAFLERNQHPTEEVENIISQSAKYSYEYANVLGERFPLGEPVICQDAKYAYKYALNVINKEFQRRDGEKRGGPRAVVAGTERQRFPEAEHTISQSPEFAYKYARYIVAGRWEMGEQAISQNAGYSVDYAKNVLKERFLAGENVIADAVGSIRESIKYCHRFIKDRWPLLEQRLLEKIREIDHARQVNNATDDQDYEYNRLLNITIRYAIHFIQERWHEIEPYIIRSEDADIVLEYAKNMIRGRWFEAEHIIKTSSRTIYYYTQDVIKDRWLEVEDVIKQDTRFNSLYLRNIVQGEWPEARLFIKDYDEILNDYMKSWKKIKAIRQDGKLLARDY